MEEYPLFLEATDIIIENQPVLKNPTMKSIQMILYSFFISKINVADFAILLKLRLFE